MCVFKKKKNTKSISQRGIKRLVIICAKKKKTQERRVCKEGRKKGGGWRFGSNGWRMKEKG